MSVNQPDPKIPNDDNGKGLRIIGWLLLIWTAISLIWINPQQWHARFMPIVDSSCFVAGLFFVGLGYWVGSRAQREELIIERAHDLALASEDGAEQHDPAA